MGEKGRGGGAWAAFPPTHPHPPSHKCLACCVLYVYNSHPPIFGSQQCIMFEHPAQGLLMYTCNLSGCHVSCVVWQGEKKQEQPFVVVLT